MKSEHSIKKVDCILIFMLDEERDYFLQFNKQFILLEQDIGEYKEFIFFDKSGKLRKGVMCSNGTAMGNTEACSLFYKLSRKYKADLYINLGVAGIYKDVNIGDVVVVSTRLTTLGEENATDAPWQLKDIPGSYIDDANTAALETKKALLDFSENTKEQVRKFKEALKNAGVEDRYNFNNFNKNVIKSGSCVTVPEVIKGNKGRENFPSIRKMNVIDMEAYYLVLWHALIKKIEPQNANKNSKILVFKSASDFGDENKQIFEDCGSRKLAMTNLCNVVSNYCTMIHTFPRKTNENILSFFDIKVKNSSADSFVKQSNANFKVIIEQFQELCGYFIETSEVDFDEQKCILSAYNLLSSLDKKIVLLSGRSGTAKSTFMSYLYYYVLNSNLKAILIDFSKYSTNTAIESTQLVYLLEKLMCVENDLYIFLDGIDVNAPYYNDLLSALEKDNYTNISYCIGNIIGGDEPIYIVPKRMNMTNIEFSGMNIYSKEFDEMLKSAEKYFKLLKCDFNIDIIKNFIIKSEIINVDFRLLSMMSNHCKEIAKTKSLYTFLNNYITAKFGRRTLMEYRKSCYIFKTENAVDVPINLMKLNSNIYATSLAVAQEIVDIFEKNSVERINEFVKSKFVLSDDMNLFLNHLLKHRQSILIIDNVIEALSVGNNKVSICIETQLLYNISGIVKSGSNQYDRLKLLLKNKVDNAKTNSRDNEGSTNNFWAIQYRTLCIVLNRYFGVTENLHEYNSKLIKNSIDSRINLYFHFLYYSKAPFTFDHVSKFDIEFLNNELFFNTYYILKRFFEDSSLSNMIICNDPFAYMNIITYLHLIDEIVIKRNKFLNLKREIKDSIERMKTILDGIQTRDFQKPVYLDTIYKEIITLTQML